mmetsp:Transcript_33559/g.74313  ORF Transcript_33559/g.74313 Transcript_33559/m.74313 type:complete len:209 (+) Transcript_33559:120-746(+)
MSSCCMTTWCTVRPLGGPSTWSPPTCARPRVCAPSGPTTRLWPRSTRRWRARSCLRPRLWTSPHTGRALRAPPPCCSSTRTCVGPTSRASGRWSRAAACCPPTGAPSHEPSRTSCVPSAPAAPCGPTPLTLPSPHAWWGVRWSSSCSPRTGWLPPSQHEAFWDTGGSTHPAPRSRWWATSTRRMVMPSCPRWALLRPWDCMTGALPSR